MIILTSKTAPTTNLLNPMNVTPNGLPRLTAYEAQQINAYDDECRLRDLMYRIVEIGEEASFRLFDDPEMNFLADEMIALNQTMGEEAERIEQQMRLSIC